jgi:UDP-N-acetylmuramate dehydrogenase
MFIENASLKKYNTFGLDVKCKKLSFVRSEEEYKKLLASGFLKDKNLVLGGGSNVLFTKDFNGWIALNQIQGKQIIRDEGNDVWLKFGSGEVWHDVVLWCLERNFGGIENLSLIPGTVGAAPIQNIGAYGVEIKDVLEEVGFLDEHGNEHSMKNQECKFGYRESIFKRELKGKAFITHVILKLTRKKHVLNYSYASLNDELKKRGIQNPTIKDISDAVIFIRKSKLPDPVEVGNAGSFFKNPTLNAEQYAEFRNKYPDVPVYPGGETTKIPAAWLIEKAGFKGMEWKGAAVHEKQPLVLINKKSAAGAGILELCRMVQKGVSEKFGIMLEPEVNIVD